MTSATTQGRFHGGAIALATSCALVCGHAAAQSNVSISGSLDIGVYRDLASKWNVGPIQRSNIVFSGSEDLGSGYLATFKLNHRFDTDTGAVEGAPNKPFWHGESTVGIKGPMGSLRLGRALDAISNNDWDFDPWYNFDRVASPAWDLWHYNFPSDPQANNGRPDYGRLNNGIFYDSPSLAGFGVHLSLSPELRTGDLNRPVGVSVTYGRDGFAAMLANEKNSAGDKDTFVALKGSFSGVTVMGAYDVSKSGASTAKATTLGVQYATGPFTFNGGWGKLDVDGVKAEQLVSVGGIYALSKRTSLYADLADKRLPGISRAVYGVGLNHSF